MTGKPEIIIDLSKHEDAQPFAEAEIIQREAMKDFFRHVNDSEQKIEAFTAKLNSKNLLDPTHHHDTIMVSGPRGSGKTSFVLSMLELITSDDKHKKLEPLGIIDPTMRKEEGHAFIHIITLIQKKVQEHHTTNFSARPTNNFENTCNTTDGAYRDWLKSLTRLAKGLISIDGIGADAFQTQNWHDPQQIMENELSTVQAGIDLAHHFHCFVQASLKFLDKTAFILAFDDIDTHCKSGWALLEVIRKYMTTPQIITILSGDINLYSIMVRQNQFKNFDKKLIDFDHKEEIKSNKNNQKYLKILNNLEKEYLLKVIKPERRIELLTLGESLHKHEIKISQKNLQGQFIQDIYNNIFKNCFFINNKNDAKALQRHFFRDSIRLNLNFLRAAKGFLTENSTPEVPESFYSHLVDLFFVPLDQGNYKPNELKHPNPETILETLISALIQNAMLTRGFRLKPEFNNQDTDSQMIAMGAIVSSLMKNNPELYFEYFIKVALTHQIGVLLPTDTKVKYSKLSLNAYYEYIGLNYRNHVINTSRSATAYLRSILSFTTSHKTAFERTVWKGTISLMSPIRDKKGQKMDWSSQDNHRRLSELYGISSTLAPSIHNSESFVDFITKDYRNLPAKQFYDMTKKTKEPYLKEMKAGYFNHIDDLYEGITSWHKNFIYHPLTNCLDSNRKTTHLFSIFSLISTIGTFAYYNTKDKTNKNKEDFALFTTSQWIASTTTTHLPVADTDEQTPLEEFDGDNIDEETTDTVLHAENKNSKYFFDKLSEWISCEKIWGLPILILARSWSRFFQTLENQDSSFYSRDLYLGNILHRQIIAFLNSILIEEDWGYGTSTLFRNATRDDKNFYINIQSVIEKHGSLSVDFKILKEKLPFFYWVATCPVWGLYINPDSPHKTLNLLDIIAQESEIDKKYFRPLYHNNDNVFPNLFDPLNSVLLNLSKEHLAKRVNQPKKTPSSNDQDDLDTNSETNDGESNQEESQATKKNRNPDPILSEIEQRALYVKTLKYIIRPYGIGDIQKHDIDARKDYIINKFLISTRNYIKPPANCAPGEAAKTFIDDIIKEHIKR